MHQLITTPNQVGQILRGRRKARRIAQRELAPKVGISQNRLSALEANTAALTLDRLLTLANVLGLELVLQDKPEARAQKAEW